MRPHAELVALEGLSSERKPAVALVIGEVDGDVVERLSRHCGEVHYFNAEAPRPTPPGNVTVHALPDRRSESLRVLNELAAEGRGADFIVLDPGLDEVSVRLDMETLLDSPGTSETVIVICDATSDPVRLGLRQLEAEAWPKVSFVDLDYVAGRMVREGPRPGEIEGGLGVIMTRAGEGALGKGAAPSRHFDTFELLCQARAQALDELADQRRLAELAADIGEDRFIDPVAEREQLALRLRECEAQYAQLREVWARTMNSFSWRVTTPLRTLKARLRRPLT